MKFLTIDIEKCKECLGRECTDVCPLELIEIKVGDSFPTIKIDDCVECDACKNKCRLEAIFYKEEEA